MSINQRGKGYEIYIRINGKRYRKTLAVKTHEEALRAEALIRQALEAGDPIPEFKAGKVKSYTLKQAANRCFNMNWVGTKSESNITAYIRELLDFFGRNTDIRDIGTEEIDSFIEKQKAMGKADGTINRKTACLSKILRFSHEQGYLSAKPFIRRLKENIGRLRYLTEDEEKALLNALTHLGYTEVAQQLIVSVDTGIRRGEMLRIKAKDVTADGLYVGESKNGHPRLIPLTKRARTALEDRIKYSNGVLFSKFYRSAWERVLNQLALEDVVWHTLRHTTCSRLVQRGMPLTHVKKWMGHKVIQVTMRYAHLAKDHLQKGAELLEQVE